MSDARLINEQSKSQPSHIDILSTIDSLLHRIHDAFLLAFTDGKTNPNGISKSYGELFDQFWNLLTISEFDTEEELNQYYDNTLRDFNHHLDHINSQISIKIDNIPENRLNLLKELIQVYRLFAKQCLVLKAFQSTDSYEHHTQRSQEITLSLDLCEREIIELNHRDIEQKLQELNLLLGKVIQRLVDLHYVEKPDSQDDPAGASPYPQSTPDLEMLDHLPSLIIIQQTLGQLAEARSQKKKEAVQEPLNLLQRHHFDVQKAKTNLQSLFESQQTLISDAIRLISDKIDKINKQIDHLPSLDQYIHLINILARFDPEANITTEIVNMKKACQALITIGLLPSNWKKAAVETEADMTTLLQLINAFNSRYLENTLSKEVLNNRLMSIRRQHLALIHLSDRLEQQLTTMTHLADQILRAFQMISSMTEPPDIKSDMTNESTTYSFLTRHWWKMLLGGAGGGGTSTTVTLLLALEPTRLGIIIAASLLAGTTLGAGLGFSQDLFFNKSHKNKLLSEEKPEQPRDDAGMALQKSLS